VNLTGTHAAAPNGTPSSIARVPAENAQVRTTVPCLDRLTTGEVSAATAMVPLPARPCAVPSTTAAPPRRLEAGGRAGLDSVRRLATVLQVDPDELMARPPDA